MRVDVLCVGHAAYDVSLFVEKFPEENSKSETDELIESGGGPAANAAYLLSTWGIPTAFAGLVGNDKYGRQIRDEFQSAGTEISLLELRSGHETPLSMIVINKQNGTRTIVNRKVKGAALELERAALHGLLPQVLLFDGHELEASCQALEAFPEAVSILDAGSWREGTAGLSSQVDYLAASERFALQCTGVAHLRDEPSRRCCLAEMRQRFASAKAIIVTLGEEGLIVDSQQSFLDLPAFRARTVDTTAAGDIFHGALAFAILKQMPLEEGLRFASMTASLSVQLRGGRQSIPALPDVKKALNHAH